MNEWIKPVIVLFLLIVMVGSLMVVDYLYYRNTLREIEECIEQQEPKRNEFGHHQKNVEKQLKEPCEHE